MYMKYGQKFRSYTEILMSQNIDSDTKIELHSKILFNNNFKGKSVHACYSEKAK